MAVRIRSRWFREGRTRPPEELAHAAAVIAWRLAQGALADLRKAGFSLEAGSGYFDALGEWLALLTHLGDRIAYGLLDDGQRRRFVVALAEHLAGTYADNRAECLGETVPAVRRMWLSQCNERSRDYAHDACVDGDPSYAMRRRLANRLLSCLTESDHAWVHAQVMDIDAPRAAERYGKALHELFGESGARSRPRVVSGE